MSEIIEVDYGPLEKLIGVWVGDKGMDVAPDPELGTIDSPFYETITFTAGGDLKNAKSQVLSNLFYRKIVKRKSNDEVFHDETGYWMWDAKERVIIHSLAIPRAVCVLAGGNYEGNNDENGKVSFEVSANVENKDWNILQSPFMQQQARTTSFYQKFTIEDSKLTYSETTMLEIYGKEFEHTDKNELIRQV